MNKPCLFEVILSNPLNAYYAGETIQGKCIVELRKETTLRGLRLHFEGKAYVEWRARRRFLRATQQYLNHNVLLWGILPNQGSNTAKLPVGRHTFSFTFQLPPRMPSSFIGEYGHVRYSVTAIIDRPWKFDYSTRQPFTVIGILDLNHTNNATAPAQGFNQKMLCCFCCTSGLISAIFYLGRQGFLPGEAIRLHANISNKSRRRIKKSYVNLKMVTTYRVKTYTNTTTKEMARVTEGPIEGGQSFAWSTQSLILPQLPPSHLAGCSIIDVRYILQLNVTPSGLALNLQIPLEIIIGSVPLREVFEQIMLLPAARSAALLPHGRSYPSPDPCVLPPGVAMNVLPLNTAPDYPPPPYSDCERNFGEEDSESKNNDESNA